MKLKKVLGAVLVGGLGLSLVFGSVVWAQEDSPVERIEMVEDYFFSGQPSVMEKGVVHDGDYYTSDEEVKIMGTINGDLYVAGGLIEIEGKVNGDVLAAGSQVFIKGEVSDDVRVAGNQIVIGGVIRKNISAAGAEVEFAKAAKVKNAVVFGNEITFRGEIERDLKAAGGEVVIDGGVGRNAEVAGAEVILGNAARVGGDLSYGSGQEAMVAKEAQILGEVRSLISDFSSGMGSVDFWISFVIGVLAMVVVGLFWTWQFPNYVEKSGALAIQKPLKVFLWGFVGVFVVPVLAVVMMLSGIGFPLGMIFLAIYLIVLYLSQIFVSFLVGRLIAKQFGWSVGQGWAVVMGIVIYSLIGLIPEVGGVLSFVAVIFGVGMQVVAKRDLMPELRKKKMV